MNYKEAYKQAKEIIYDNEGKETSLTSLVQSQNERITQLASAIVIAESNNQLSSTIREIYERYIRDIA